ncbi:phospholipid/cholesterol/gamma-HCH transport system permease protein [Anseongella ginsenosidimutans]|uniref:Phospholipid/cholesterol/gamma-HCH transport system permease protein n=1 Tax=Anseongella ginsenosidimutans TaxID=496056 RepID=A0A4R3KNW3_9SPHI|nr:ABC transporter permease [Anseongella ginsenosidimutans]QEC53874.1 ABC transporter permease [Anseongella ginsenosidimutans]TCS86256.1 phospholipid/cholesterol/gamma-HCH transport system permease protein [Anseongella ginsenosidimutans]
MVFYHFGRYIRLLKSSFSPPENYRMYWKELTDEMVSMGIGSLGIVAVVSVSFGAVMAVQTAYQLTSDLIPKSLIATITRDSSILELSPTIGCLILTGRIGSRIASQIGTMRVTEQIDALEIMGINSPAYLILPKLISGITMIPLLVIISMFLSIMGGLVACSASGVLSTQSYLQTITEGFIPFMLTVGLIKSFIFAFIMTTVAAYQGFYVRGGALEVGESSTRAMVVSCIMILVADYLVAQILL